MKKQFKRSMSLFLSVLMLLSCWVWVAPEKAEAAGQKYTVTVETQGEMNAAEKEHYINFYNEQDVMDRRNWGNAENGTVGEETFELNYWPKKMYFVVSSNNVAKANIKTVKINNVVIFNDSWQLSASGGIVWSTSDKVTFEYNSTAGSWDFTKYWTVPKVTSIKFSSAEITTPLTKFPNNSSVEVAYTVNEAKDQYGAIWDFNSLPQTGYSYSLKDANDNPISSNYATVSGTGPTATVTVKNDAQMLFPDANKGEIYLHATYNGSESSSKITFYNPTYSATFNGNGGKIGMNADGSGAADTYKIDTGKIYYGSEVGKAPSYQNRANYTFLGFYQSNQNGTDLIVDGLNDDAVKNKTKFVNAGENGATKIDQNGDQTWYAAWQAKKVNATFISADNQKIGVIEGRYGNYLLNSDMYGTEGEINKQLHASYTSSGKTSVKFDSDNKPIYSNKGGNLTFSHWEIVDASDNSLIGKKLTDNTILNEDVTYQAVYKVADAQKFTVTFKDTNGSNLSQKSYDFRAEVQMPTQVPTLASSNKYNYEFAGWAKNVGTTYYKVDENGKDENGALIPYISKDTNELLAREDITYVPVFKMVAKEFKVTFYYNVDGGAQESKEVLGYHYGDSITLPEEVRTDYTKDGYRYTITGWQVNSGETKPLDDIVVTSETNLVAKYGVGEPAKYKIVFLDKDENEIKVDKNIFKHNETITFPDVPTTIDTDEALYTFKNWEVVGRGETTAIATADATYQAMYTEQVYADITYMNGEEVILSLKGNQANSMFVGEQIPAFSGTLPTKAEDQTGTYTFSHWVDKNGKKVVPGEDKFTGDTVLFAEFNTTYKEYKVTFDFANGSEVYEKTYHYNEAISLPENPVKEKDETYTYTFLAWSPDVEEICHGDAAYTALYNKSYRYYPVTWFNDDKTEKRTSSYIFGERYNPLWTPDSMKESANEGYTLVIDKWVLCDKDGNAITDKAGRNIYWQLGNKISEGITEDGLYFYPTYKEVANAYNVNFYNEDGKIITTVKVEHGTKFSEITGMPKAVKTADETYHYTFTKWLEKDSDNAFDTNREITSDVSVKAEFEKAVHNQTEIANVIKAPTCTEKGLVDLKCDAESCGLIKHNQVVDEITDTKAPTVTVTLGKNNWKSGEEVNFEALKYEGGKTNLIINATDLGEVSEPWNPNGNITRRVGKISYYISESVENVEEIAESKWVTAYDYDAVYNEVFTEALFDVKLSKDEFDALKDNNPTKQKVLNAVSEYMYAYESNVGEYLEDMGLTDGKEYIIYVKVSDREVNGSANTAYASTGKFHYGTQAPTIDISGEGVGTKFCREATITVTDDLKGFKVYIDGVQKYVVPTEDGKSASIDYSETGIHTITVLDVNGNSTTSTFEIKGKHTVRNYTIAASCTTAGSNYDLCTLCGEKTHETVIPAKGHKLNTFTEVQPTCTVDGSRTYKCSACKSATVEITPNLVITKSDSVSDKDLEDIKKLTTADLAHLKSKGEHTYPVVLDKDGKETTELKWVIDKEATCSAEGEKHINCSLCGFRLEEKIDKDTENGHRYYRAKTAKNPTCTEDGYKNQTCKYCGSVKERAEIIPATGHTAGEYVFVEGKAPTCEEKGKKILTCADCNAEIGEPDGKGGFTGEAVEVDALGHKLVYKETVEPKDGEQGYDVYECAREGCEYTEKKNYKDHEDEFTVSFVYGDDKTVEVTKKKNETIISSDVETPTKAEDDTYKYVFDYWEDENNNKVEFPITVTENLTLKPVFKAEAFLYVLTYNYENGNQYGNKVGYLKKGDKVTLKNGPAKSSDWEYSYKFSGWKDSDDKVWKAGEEYTVMESSTLTATYERVKNTYVVTFGYTMNNTIETITVEAGSKAVCSVEKPEAIKAPTIDCHYTFNGWDKANAISKVESNVYTAAVFVAEGHDWEAVESTRTNATCTTAGTVIYKCSECGFEKTEEISPALGHNFKDPTPELNAKTGEMVYECQRENCEATKTEAATYNVVFYAYDDHKVSTVYDVLWGNTISSSEVPATASKPSDTLKYTFKAWGMYVDGKLQQVDPATVVIKEETSFYAIYDTEDVMYTVNFRLEGSTEVLKSYKVKPGSSVVYDGAAPKKDYDANVHYVFAGWSADTSNVQSDMDVTAKFTAVKHSYTESVLNEATCDKGKGYRYECVCGDHYEVTGNPLKHNWVETGRVEPSNGQNGSINYECKACHKPKSETIQWVDNTMIIEIYVKDRDGKAVEGATVQLYRNDLTDPVTSQKTNHDGQVIFRVEKGYSYSYLVEYDGKNVTGDKVNVGEGSTNVTIEGSKCSCACHGDGLWSTIFRFFHKIIKMLTGEFKCCNDPDPRY